MKQHYTYLLFLFIYFTGTAQIINIPDPDFKAWLVQHAVAATNANGDDYNTDVDANDDGEIQMAEAAAVTGLALSTSLIDDTGNLVSLEGIANFTNLKRLHCDGNSLTSLDVSMIPSLTYLNCGHNQLSSLNISGLSQLKEIWCNSNQLTALNLDGLTGLEELNSQDNHLSTLSFDSIPSVRTLWLSGNEFVTMDLTMLSELQTLSADNNQISQLNVAGLGNLSAISAGYNQLTGLDLDGVEQLDDLLLSHNMISNLDLSVPTEITYMELSDNPLTAIDLSALHNLSSLLMNNTLVTSIDCSQTAISQLSCKDSPNLASININNGIYSYNDADLLFYSLIFGNLPSLQNICVDNGEQEAIIPGNFYNAFGNVAVHTGDNCDVGIQMGIAENTIEKFILAPNPASDIIQVQGKNISGPLKLKIYTVTGMIVKTYENLTIGAFIDVSGLSGGTYLMKIENGTHHAVQRLIKV
ncbi:T9SS type A sorting domain-containing protein [Flavobacterium pallidum]|uniref:Secretion system C-terminal sorting domain-containing protein n=1 Tax=Flavobacterium pallidum TaxID=2172098 RepID=A0A2S1SIK7_9FLAO|nr:T9SS type A sorting domain-containing protein [Flavobacterium pallidum]AWI26189.1 hypothetical protein HYN49_09915 [Flavobacterium pallidum]